MLDGRLPVLVVFLGLLLLLLDVFLGVGAHLGAGPRADMLLHTFPILPVNLDRLVKPVLLLLCPAPRRRHFQIVLHAFVPLVQ